jgi:alkylation response protein AidB-like acyl-CoA dehydrogenase
VNLAPSPRQGEVVARARALAEGLLAPRAVERDRHEQFPVEELGELARAGLLGVNVPAALGGAEAGAVGYALAIMEIARADASVAVAMAVTNMAAELIRVWGTEAQTQRWVRPIVDGTHVCAAFALSEPQAGSDPAGMLTTAIADGSEFVLRGTKQWITSGTHAGAFVVWARTDLAAGVRGISAFLVEKGTPGLGIGKSEEKLGLRGSSTVQLHLEDVRVAGDQLLGRPGDGFRIAMTALDGGRIGIGGQAVGIATAALEGAAASEAVCGPDGAAQLLGDMATWRDAARLLVLRAAWRKQGGLPFTREASMAKLYASERASRICELALSLVGEEGAVRERGLERLLRDARVTRIYEGTSEIQRIVVAREVFRS